MTPQTNEPVGSTELAPQAPPTDSQLAPSPAPQGAETAPNPVADNKQPDAAALQAELAAARAEAQRLAEQAREHQAAYTRSQQQLRAMIGEAQPQADPLAPFLKQYTDIGIADADARVLAKRDYDMELRFTRLQSAVTGQTQVPVAIQQAVSGMPMLQSVQHLIHADIQQEVARGNMDALNPEYIRTIGARHYVDSLSKQPTGQVAPTHAPSAIPNFPSQFGPLNGYQAPAQQLNPNAPPPGVEQWKSAEAAAIAQRFGFQTQTNK